jgi:hypothetical protein
MFPGMAEMLECIKSGVDYTQLSPYRIFPIVFGTVYTVLGRRLRRKVMLLLIAFNY